MRGKALNRKPKPTALYVEIDPRLRTVLEQIRVRDGVPLRAQLERAIVLWARSKGLEVAA